MAFWSRKSEAKTSGPVLVVEGLDVYYGRAHALQTVSFTIEKGVLGIVGRNGMGKTTLCNAITGLVPSTGSVKLLGEEIQGRAPNEITQRGIAYVPQGRRVWPSLSVDETLKLVAVNKREVDRVYAMFPRLAERKANGGAQLSGGEQQMLAIGRALLLDPKLLVMDEPTEGLAPIIVEQVAQALRALAHEGEIAVLLIEQNLGVALEVADRVGVMVNGRIAQEMPSAQLAADREMQERLLGVKGGGYDEPDETQAAPALVDSETAAGLHRTEGLRRRRAVIDDLAPRTVRGFNRWNSGDAAAQVTDIARETSAASGQAPSPLPSPAGGRGGPTNTRVVDFPVAATTGRAAYVAGTFDTKGARALLPAPMPREARAARCHGRPRDQRQAFAGKRASARGRAPSPARRIGGLLRRPRQRSHGDGRGLRAVHPHAQ